VDNSRISYKFESETQKAVHVNSASIPILFDHVANVLVNNQLSNNLYKKLFYLLFIIIIRYLLPIKRDTELVSRLRSSTVFRLCACGHHVLRTCSISRYLLLSLVS